MKFLCVPCDSPMKLQNVGPPERGSLSVVYSCPECGYEIAMLTNAYETQVVQSLGVRIGPENGAGASNAPGSGCPFTEMIPGTSRERSGDPAPRQGSGRPEPGSKGASERVGGAGGLIWTPAAEARLAKIPEFIRPMARTGIERFARERGTLEVDEKMLDEARDFFGM
jgi:proto-chlorophyllide reductase subunit